MKKFKLLFAGLMAFSISACAEKNEEHRHSLSLSWEYEKYPTETEDGLKYRQCSTCDFRVEQVVYSLLVYELSEDESYYIVYLGATQYDGAITIPSTYKGLPVNRIKERGFLDCEALTSITIPTSITYIGENAFNNAPKLNNFVYEGTSEEWKALSTTFKMKTSITKVVHCSDGDVDL